jgi:hypothetical protein
MFKKIFIGVCLMSGAMLATSAFAQDNSDDAAIQQCIQVAMVYAQVAADRDVGVSENEAFAGIVDANADTMSHEELDQVYQVVDAIYAHPELAPDDVGNMVLQECVGQ